MEQAIMTHKGVLTKPQRVAIVLQSLDLDLSALILKALSEEDVEKITAAMHEVDSFPDDIRERVLRDFVEQMRSGRSGSFAGLRPLLEKSLGNERAASILSKVRKDAAGPRHFQFLNDLDPQQVYGLLRQERAQTVALVLCHIDPKLAGLVVSHFDPEFQSRMMVRMGRMNRVSPEIISRVESVLRKRLTGAGGKAQEAGGAKVIADVLNQVDRGTEKRIFETLQTQDSNLAEEVKKLMLVFSDLVSLSAHDIQILLREVEKTDLAIALKGASPELRELVLSNMSIGAREHLKEDMELMGAKPRSEVEEAQQLIMATVRRLEEEDKIHRSRSGGDEELLS